MNAGARAQFDSSSAGQTPAHRRFILLILVALAGCSAGIVLFTNAQRTSFTSTEAIFVEIRPGGVWIGGTRVDLPPDVPGAASATSPSPRHIVIQLETERYRRGIGFGSHVWLISAMRDDVWLRASSADAYTPGLYGDSGPVREDRSGNIFVVLFRGAPQHPPAQPALGLDSDPALQLALAAAGKWYDERPDVLGTRGLGALIAQGGGTRFASSGGGLVLWLVGTLIVIACGALAIAGFWVVQKAME